jgi:GDP/UDP-N,N'-diacetylbacillosamine 2-epimerase (hydrolysing)
MKVLAVTGIRSEYDILQPVLKAMSQRNDFDVMLVVAGAHLSATFGETVCEIEKDGFSIVDRLESLLDSNHKSSRVKGLGIALMGLVQTVERVKPDLLLVVGDREEAMMTALVGAYCDIAVAHIAGGDRVVGNVDDQIRHAVSRLAHIHYVTNSESAQRIERMGEQLFRIVTVGTPGIDRLISEPKLSMAQINQALDIHLPEQAPFLVVLQHVISSEAEQGYWQMQQTLEAVRELALPTVVIYPNSDAGGREMIRCIEDYAEQGFFVALKNIPRLPFVNLLRHTACLVGNSSAGIMEAPALHLPVINIGNRQQGRHHANNVQFVSHDVSAIVSAINRAVFDADYRHAVTQGETPYGDGQAAQRIVAHLQSIQLNADWLIKDITY